jgi:hypothetical protein
MAVSARRPLRDLSNRGRFRRNGEVRRDGRRGRTEYSEEMQQTPPTPEAEEVMARMGGNFDLFIAHEIRWNGEYLPDFEALRNAPTRIVSAAGETSDEQAARRSALALADRLDIPVTYLPGAHGGWGSDPAEFPERLHEVLQGT